MAIDYQAPGVSVTEYTESSIAPLLDTSDTVALIGPAKGAITVVKNITTPNASPYTNTLVDKATGTLGSIVSVLDLDASSAGNAYTTNGYPSSAYTTSTDSNGNGIITWNSTNVVTNTLKANTAVSSNSTSITLTGNTNLVANTTYYISSGSNIPANTTFTTGATVSSTPTITLSTATTGNINTTDTITISLPVATNRTVTVTYTYVPVDYWTPQVFYDVPSVVAKFGNKYSDDQKTINSPLSLAAELAFANGATSVVIQPVFYQNTSSGVKTVPSNAQLRDDTADANGSSWTASLNSLRNINNIGAIVPIIGQASAYNFGTGSSVNMTTAAVQTILQNVQDHIVYQQTVNGEYMIGIFGQDGTDTGGSYATQSELQTSVSILQSAYNGVYNQEIAHVSPSKFSRVTPNGTILSLGGQYVAAAVAGALMARRASATLTRKNIIGFTSVNDVRTRSQMTDDSRKGLLVLEQKGSGVIQVRHAVTTDISTIAKSELSVSRAKNKLAASLRKTIDTQIIGQVVADNNAPLIVASAIGGVLSRMVNDGDIVSFADVQAKFLTNNPTAIDVRFNYRPAFPINNVSIGFSVDLSTGTLNLNTNITGVSNG